jgi:hypothetical protein
MNRLVSISASSALRGALAAIMFRASETEVIWAITPPSHGR